MHAAITPAWPCEPSFGPLCPSKGLGVLSVADVSLARRSGLRVFVYRNVPPRFHHALFSSGQPAEVRHGATCDFVRAPCTPADPPIGGAYSRPLNEWLHAMKHCADVPLLAKLLALGALPGVATAVPSEAHLFVVPFLGGFIERVSPAMSQVLEREQRQTGGRGVVDKLFDHLPHLNNRTASRHLFLLTNSCGGCLRGPCAACAPWQRVRAERPAAIELAVTLGPSWPTDKIPRGREPPDGRGRWLRQVIVPPNVMESELHAPRYVPLCPRETPHASSLISVGQNAAAAAAAARVAAAAAADADVGAGGGGVGSTPCRPLVTRQNGTLLAFYQGAHSFNGIRDAVLRELHEAVFSGSARDEGSSRGGGAPGGSGGGKGGSGGGKGGGGGSGAQHKERFHSCDCARQPSCCVNETAG